MYILSGEGLGQTTTTPSQSSFWLRDKLEQGMIQVALGKGARNEDELTDLIFRVRHPERQGRKLMRGEPQFAQLSQEWLDIRNRLVRPALQALSPSAATPAIPSTPVPTPTTPSGSIPSVHLPVKAGRIIARSQAGGRAFPLNEPGQPRRDGSTPAQKSEQLTRIVNWLQVESSNRYAAAAGKTYCNIYAHDYCYLAGVYLPRVWWMRAALAKLAQGQAVPIQYGKTVAELNANSLTSWLEEFGPRFGWIQTTDLTELQRAANQGQVCVITAQRTELNKAGHICLVVPETSSYKAQRSGNKVTAPLQSQAGRNNFRYGTKRWWTDSRFRKYSFWMHS